MSLLDKLERRFRRFAVPHVTLAIVIGQALVFFGGMANPEVMGTEETVGILELQWGLVFAGDWWRPLTFIFEPASGILLFLIFELYLFWLFGSALENEWGTFRYNVYLLIGYVLTLGAAAIDPSQRATNVMFLASVFLAFAYLYPDFTLLLFFILPVKVKWLAMITWVLFALGLLINPTLQSAALIVGGTANYMIFFGPQIIRRLRSKQRALVHESERVREREEAFHQCVVCGRTDKSDPHLHFRYARTSDGVECFCEDHVGDADSDGGEG